MAATSPASATEEMTNVSGNPADFVRQKNSVDTIVFASSDGTWSRIDILDSPTVPTEVEVKNKYFLTKGVASSLLNPYRPKRGVHKWNGIGAWEALRKKNTKAIPSRL